VSSTDVFRRIIAALHAAGIPYMLTGTFASSLHGLTRATQGIDLVIAPTESQLRDLVGNLPPEVYYVDLEAAHDALRQRTQFKVVDLDTGWKIDLIVRRNRPFSVQEFERRRVIDLEYVDDRVTRLEPGEAWKLAKRHAGIE
jgi:hypothetical protein